MKVAKEKRRVTIFFNDGTHVGGYIYISEGKRILDSLNERKGNFIAMTDVEGRNNGFLIVNKFSIKWLEEF